MKKERINEEYVLASIEILTFASGDVVCASDLFTGTENPGGSTSSGSWT